MEESRDDSVEIISNVDLTMSKYILYGKYGLFTGSVLVAENGKVIYKKGIGMANMEWDIPNAPDTNTD